jgi:putative lipoprotein
MDPTHLRRAGTFLLLLFLVTPHNVAAEDKWLAADKARHFGAGAGIAAGGYGLSVPFTAQTRWRLLFGTGAGLGAGAARELRDRSGGGQPSWRDFTWSAVGTSAGVLIAWAIDKAID